MFPVELFGEEPSLSKVKSAALLSELEFTIDHGLGFGAITGQDFNLKALTESDSSTN